MDRPIPRQFYAARISGRDTTELLGIARGILASGEVTEGEARFLKDWVDNHPDLVDTWPANHLVALIQRIFADGVLEDGEREELRDLLEHILGGEPGTIGGAQRATTLPLDHPPPPVIFRDCRFVFTGRFALGPRSACRSEVVDRGGFVDTAVTRRTDYLVIGTLGNEAWAQSSFGRKIEQAVKRRDVDGWPLRIIDEDHWAAHL